ncbi:MAG TPA: hypothetical protein PK156_50030, partial [Polyangium sp.]|nr:hypothetical protein [Polyangium sp.]
EFADPTDLPLVAPKASASAAPAPSAAPVASAKTIETKKPGAAPPPQDSRDPWSQIIDEISEEKAGNKKPAPAKP